MASIVKSPMIVLKQEIMGAFTVMAKENLHYLERVKAEDAVSVATGSGGLPNTKPNRSKYEGSNDTNNTSKTSMQISCQTLYITNVFSLI